MDIDTILDKAKELLPQQPAKQEGQEEDEVFVRTYVGEDTWVASASYIPFISAAILVLRKNNSEFVSFHARQALVILLIIIFALVLLPVVLKIIAAMGAYALLVYGAYQAVRGRKWYLPVVTEIANTFDL
jgi:uncharacterized membrane protein